MSLEEGAVACVRDILDRVYSPYTGPTWKPKPFQGSCRRYLWSDAFGVCHYISMFYAHKRDARFLEQAEILINDVHDDLGCYRNTTTRLPGASDEWPTRGGLRIGKEEEECDGQYFHYLTKWMFALNRLSVAKEDAKYNEWAIDLARVAHDKFMVRGVGGRPLHMVWKMSVDLERVLVSSEGNLDPMDGLVTFKILQQTSGSKATLQREIAEMQQLVTRKMQSFTTQDALDSGEAMLLSQWVPSEKWAAQLEEVAHSSIDRLFHAGRFREPEGYRLMFREMGTVLGMHVARRNLHNSFIWHTRLDNLVRFWSGKVFARDADITPLMYAAARFPGVWSPHFLSDMAEEEMAP